MVIEPEGATQVELTTVIVGGTGVVLSFSSTLSVLEVLVQLADVTTLRKQSVGSVPAGTA